LFQIGSAEGDDGGSKRARQVKQRLEKLCLTQAQNNGDDDPTDKEVQAFVRRELNAAKVFKFYPVDMQTLRRYVYDHGMEGTADKDLMEDLYAEFNLDEFAAARRDKVDVSYLYEPPLHWYTADSSTAESEQPRPHCARGTGDDSAG
jgi:hypothetical protein